MKKLSREEKIFKKALFTGLYVIIWPFFMLLGLCLLPIAFIGWVLNKVGVDLE